MEEIIIKFVSGIYTMVHKNSKTIYIGQSNNIIKRLCEHLRVMERGTHSAECMNRYYRSDGQNGFSFYILEEMPNSTQLERLAAENKWHNYYEKLVSHVVVSCDRNTTDELQEKYKRRA
jgi:group I intron endonuclease